MIPSPSHRPVVLIVDDEPVNIELLAALFHNDYDIKVANDGHSAIEIAQRDPNPDLILLDVMMPNLDGFEVCRQLKAHPKTRHIPVIFITAIGSEAESKGFHSGAVDYISKPINTKITKLRVKVHMDVALYRRRLQENASFLSTMIESAPLAVTVVTPNFDCQYMNRLSLQLLGFSSLQLAKQDKNLAALNCFAFDDAFRYRRAFVKALQGQHAQLQIDVLSQKGAKHWIDLRLSPLFDAYGQISGVLVLGIDMTTSKQTQERLQLLAKVFEHTLEGVVITNSEGQVVDLNPAYCKITGYSRQEVLSSQFGIPAIDDYGKNFMQAILEAVDQSGKWQGEIFNRRKDGDLITELLSLTPIKNSNDDIQYYLGVFNDITLLKENEAKLEKISHYDILTGLPNRILLLDRIKKALANIQKNKTLIAICYLDIDEFKDINSRYGVEVGNSLLQEYAKRLQSITSSADTIARVGGDEFVIILQGLKNNGDCKLRLDKVLAELKQEIVFKDETFILSASVGVTMAHDACCDPDTLLRQADHAMYSAKSSGKNCFHYFDVSEEERVRDLNGKLQRIRQALDNEEFELFFQPKVHLLENCLVGAEALIRWRHPELGLLPPSEFLPLITDTELELKLGEWVLETAFAQQNHWRKLGLIFELSINISAHHLQSQGFFEFLSQTIKKYPKLSPHTIQLEVLETAALEDLDTALQTIVCCKGLGVNFALDDFGTGYSSLTYLCKLPVSTIKIDQTFVRDLLNDEASYAIVVGVIGLSKSLSREIVAEGIETEKHYNTLAELGCMIGQGYAIAKPMPAAQFEAWCTSFSRPAASHSSTPHTIVNATHY